MDIIISSSSGKPIYEQITGQIKAMMLGGTLRPGEALPSMRALAKALHISVITVQKAYEDLQRDGFIETTVGKGTFVAPLNREFVREEMQRRVEEHLQRAVDDAREGGLTLEQLTALLKLFYEGE